MIAAADLVGTVEIVDRVPTRTGVIVDARVEDPVLGRIDDVRLAAPAAAMAWDAATLMDWVRQVMERRAARTLEREIDEVVEALRRGENPLRDGNGNLRGTAHLPYAEAAAATYRRLSASTAARDRIVAAGIVQALDDAELTAVTGLDAAGIQALRDQAAAALQAAALMRQAGGEW